jgi:outer membrane lipoprotein-sorting protein
MFRNSHVSSFTLAALVLSHVVPALCAAAPPTAQAAPPVTADAVVAKNLEARGGLEKLKALQTARITGKIVAGGRELTMTVWSKRPNLMRRQVEADGEKMMNGFDGTTAWTVIGGKPQTFTGAQAEAAKSEAEFDHPFVDYKAKGHAIEFVGTETVNGRSAYHLRLTRKTGGPVQDHYIDAETGLEVRLVATVEQAGKTLSFVTEYGDYRKVDGVVVPFTMRQTVNGTPNSEVTFEKVEFNVPLEDAFFGPSTGG